MVHRIYEINLNDMLTGKGINEAGGQFWVTAANSQIWLSLVDPETGAAASNPGSINQGQIKFGVDDSVLSVDVFGFAPSGQSFEFRGIGANGLGEVYIDKNRRFGNHLIIPFDAADPLITANTFFDPGIDIPAGFAFQGRGAGVHVVTVDATETINVGFLSSESGGDEDGLIDGESLAVAGWIACEPVLSGATQLHYASTRLGALLVDFEVGADSNTDGGVHDLRTFLTDGAPESLGFETSAGTDTAAGYIVLPYNLPAIV